LEQSRTNHPNLYAFPPHPKPINAKCETSDRDTGHTKKSRSGLQSACDELIDKGEIITGK
jgi:hypothetical protein